MQFLYFVYGSHMLSERLRSLVRLVRVIGCALLEYRRFSFNKPSKVGSSKANLSERLGGTIWVVLYEVDAQNFDTLDE